MFFEKKENRIAESSQTSLFHSNISKKWDGLLEQDNCRLVEADSRMRFAKNSHQNQTPIDRNSSQILNKDSHAESLLCENPIEKIRQKTLALKKKIE